MAAPAEPMPLAASVICVTAMYDNHWDFPVADEPTFGLVMPAVFGWLETCRRVARRCGSAIEAERAAHCLFSFVGFERASFRHAVRI